MRLERTRYEVRPDGKSVPFDVPDDASIVGVTWDRETVEVTYLQDADEVERQRLLDDLDRALELLRELAGAYPHARDGYHPAMGTVQEAHRLLARSWARKVSE